MCSSWAWLMMLVLDGNRFLRTSWKLSVLAQKTARCAWRGGRETPAVLSSRISSPLIMRGLSSNTILHRRRGAMAAGPC